AAALHRRAVADERLADAVAGEQPGRHARVLRRDRTNLAQHAQGAGADVLQVSYWRCHHVERAHRFLASQGWLGFAEPWLRAASVAHAWPGAGGFPTRGARPPCERASQGWLGFAEPWLRAASVAHAWPGAGGFPIRGARPPW